MTTFNCEMCSYKTQIKCNYDRHMNSTKHLENQKMNTKEILYDKDYKEYDILQKKYDILKQKYELLMQENNILQTENTLLEQEINLFKVQNNNKTETTCKIADDKPLELVEAYSIENIDDVLHLNYEDYKECILSEKDCYNKFVEKCNFNINHKEFMNMYFKKDDNEIMIYIKPNQKINVKKWISRNYNEEVDLLLNCMNDVINNWLESIKDTDKDLMNKFKIIQSITENTESKKYKTLIQSLKQTIIKNSYKIPDTIKQM